MSLDVSNTTVANEMSNAGVMPHVPPVQSKQQYQQINAMDATITIILHNYYVR